MTDDLVEAWRQLRLAQLRLRHARAGTGLPETDGQAVDAIIWAADTRHALGPKDLAGCLGITTASATVLIQRLVDQGLVEKRNDQHDRRRKVLLPTRTARSDAASGVPLDLPDDVLEHATDVLDAFTEEVNAQTERAAASHEQAG